MHMQTAETARHIIISEQSNGSPWRTDPRQDALFGVALATSAPDKELSEQQTAYNQSDIFL